MQVAVHDLLLVGNQVPLVYLLQLAHLLGFEKHVLPISLLYFAQGTGPFRQELEPLILKHGFGGGAGAAHGASPLMHAMLECNHLLDYVYTASCFNIMEILTGRDIASKTNQFTDILAPKRISIPRATELRKVGILVKAAKGHRAAAVTYQTPKTCMGTAVIELPKLQLDSVSECSLRSLLVYEGSSNHAATRDLLSYASLLDSLIQGPEDVQLLCEAGVLENRIGSNEQLQKIWKGILPGGVGHFNDNLRYIALAITSDYTDRWRLKFYKLYALFLSKPWLVLFIIAAVVLLVIIVMQILYYVKSNP